LKELIIDILIHFLQFIMMIVYLQQNFLDLLFDYELIIIYIFIVVVLIILRMYQNEVTDEMFRKNIHTYLYQQ